MITLKAKIHLYENIRTKSFQSGYRPAFDFGMGSFTSGRIILTKGKEVIFPGEIAYAEINFLFREFVGDIKKGQKVYFYEGFNCVGEAEILEIISLD